MSTRRERASLSKHARSKRQEDDDDSPRERHEQRDKRYASKRHELPRDDDADHIVPENPATKDKKASPVHLRCVPGNPTGTEHLFLLDESVSLQVVSELYDIYEKTNFPPKSQTHVEPLHFELLPNYVHQLAPKTIRNKKKGTYKHKLYDDIVEALFKFPQGCHYHELIPIVEQIELDRFTCNTSSSSSNAKTTHHQRRTDLKTHIRIKLNSNHTKRHEVFRMQDTPTPIGWFILRTFITPNNLTHIIQHLVEHANHTVLYKIDFDQLVARLWNDIIIRQYELWRVFMEQYIKSSQIQQAVRLGRDISNNTAPNKKNEVLRAKMTREGLVTRASQILDVYDRESIPTAGARDDNVALYSRRGPQQQQQYRDVSNVDIIDFFQTHDIPANFTAVVLDMIRARPIPPLWWIKMSRLDVLVESWLQQHKPSLDQLLRHYQLHKTIPDMAIVLHRFAPMHSVDTRDAGDNENVYSSTANVEESSRDTMSSKKRHARREDVQDASSRAKTSSQKRIELPLPRDDTLESSGTMAMDVDEPPIQLETTSDPQYAFGSHKPIGFSKLRPEDDGVFKREEPRAFPKQPRHSPQIETLVPETRTSSPRILLQFKPEPRLKLPPLKPADDMRALAPMAPTQKETPMPIEPEPAIRFMPATPLKSILKKRPPPPPSSPLSSSSRASSDDEFEMDERGDTPPMPPSPRKSALQFQPTLSIYDKDPSQPRKPSERTRTFLDPVTNQTNRYPLEATIFNPRDYYESDQDFFGIERGDDDEEEAEQEPLTEEDLQRQQAWFNFFSSDNTLLNPVLSGNQVFEIPEYIFHLTDAQWKVLARRCYDEMLKQLNELASNMGILPNGRPFQEIPGYTLADMETDLRAMHARGGLLRFDWVHNAIPLFVQQKLEELHVPNAQSGQVRKEDLKHIDWNVDVWFSHRRPQQFTTRLTQWTTNDQLWSNLHRKFLRVAEALDRNIERLPTSNVWLKRLGFNVPEETNTTLASAGSEEVRKLKPGDTELNTPANLIRRYQQRQQRIPLPEPVAFAVRQPAQPSPFDVAQRAARQTTVLLGAVDGGDGDKSKQPAEIALEENCGDQQIKLIRSTMKAHVRKQD